VTRNVETYEGQEESRAGVDVCAGEAGGAQGTILGVEFFKGATSLGSAAGPPYSATATLSTVGSHAIFARATDSFGFTADSAPLVLTAQSQPPTVQITSPAAGASFRAPATIGLAATASDPKMSVRGGDDNDHAAAAAFEQSAISSPEAIRRLGLEPWTISSATSPFRGSDGDVYFDFSGTQAYLRDAYHYERLVMQRVGREYGRNKNGIPGGGQGPSPAILRGVI